MYPTEEPQAFYTIEEWIDNPFGPDPRSPIWIDFWRAFPEESIVVDIFAASEEAALKLVSDDTIQLVVVHLPAEADDLIWVSIPAGKAIPAIPEGMLTNLGVKPRIEILGDSDEEDTDDDDDMIMLH